jgi:hypothetical protein
MTRMPSDEAFRREFTEPRVTYPTDINHSFVMPDNVDLRRLYFLVTRLFPQLGPARDRNEAEELRLFGFAFQRIAHLGRTDKLDTQHAVSWWTDEATTWLKSQNVNLIRLLPPDFAIAVLAHGDIPHAGFDRFPHGFAVGLNAGRWGRPAVDTWRRVLETQSVKQPTTTTLRPVHPRDLEIMRTMMPE